MKNTRIALLALATTLAISPLAFGGTISLTGNDGTFATFDLTGTFTAGKVVTSLTGTFDQSGAGPGDTVAVGYKVVAPVHEGYMGPGIKNDNVYINTDNPFTANGLLIQITGAFNKKTNPLAGDYIYINGINGLDTDQVAVTVFKHMNGGEVVSLNYTVTNHDVIIPEPSSLLLLGSCILGLAGLLFWKSKSSANSLPSLSL